jgi:Holliday junction resolvase
MNNKAKGTARELQVVRQLRADGWVAFRAPASLGVADVIALKAGERPLLIEVKSGIGSPFTPDKRAALSEAAHRAGADAYLIHWPAHGKQMWIRESVWPVARSVAA